MSLTAEQILARKARRTKQVKAFGGDAYVRALSCGEQIELEKLAEVTLDDPDEAKAMNSLALRLQAYLSDENGACIATLEQALAIVRDQDKFDVRAVIEAGAEFNNWTKAAEETARGN